MKIRQILIMLLTGITVSCGDSDIPSGEYTDGATDFAMDFAGMVVNVREGVDTRASELYVANNHKRNNTGLIPLTAQNPNSRMGLFGYFTGSLTWNQYKETVANGGTGHPATASVFYNTPMDIDNYPLDEEYLRKLTYSPLRFWGTDEYFSFWTYYPYTPTIGQSADAGNNGIQIIPDENHIGKEQGRGVIDFNMNTYTDEQVDFMISNVVMDQTRQAHRIYKDADGEITSTVTTSPYGTSPVLFQLHHMLAQIRIYVNNKMYSRADFKREKGTEWDGFTPDQKTMTRTQYIENEWKALSDEEKSKIWPVDSLDNPNFKIEVAFENIWTHGQVRPLDQFGNVENDFNCWSGTGMLGSSIIRTYDFGNAEDGTLIEFDSYGKLKDKDGDVLATGFPQENIMLVIPQWLADSNVPRIVARVVDKDNPAVEGSLTINMLGQRIRWMPGYVYSYAFGLSIRPGDHIVEGPEAIDRPLSSDYNTEQWVRKR